MLDIKFIRDNKDVVIAGAKKKHIKVDIDRLLQVDDKRRALQVSIDEKRAEQNNASVAIAGAKDGAEKQGLISRMQNVKETLRLEEESMQEIMKEWRDLMLQVPTVPDMTVSEGESDADNKEVRRWFPESGFDTKLSEVPCLPAGRDFPIKSHTELLLMHDMADYERGAKVAGFRGYFLKNDGARLVWALHHFVEERFVQLGFTPMVVPSVVRREAFVGTGYLPQ